jgi:hypothetical protein
MKQSKSTRHKNGPKKFDFKNQLKLESDNLEGKNGISQKRRKHRKMTDDDQPAQGVLTSRKEKEDNDKLDISPVSSDDGGPDSFGFMPMNNLSKNIKVVDKMKASTDLGFMRPERLKLDKRKTSQFKAEKEAKLKPSHSIGGRR